MATREELDRGYAEIQVTEERHQAAIERGDFHRAPEMDRVTGLALTAYLSTIQPGDGMTWLLFQQFDRTEFIPRLVALAHTIGYTRALEDLRQEKVVI